MIYFDNGATTPVCPEARQAVLNAFERFANPSSPYGIGVEAKNRIKRSAAIIEKIINAEDGTFYFTSGATEANNWAIAGVAGATRSKHMITVKTEHPSVLEPFAGLEKKRFEVDYISVDRRGSIDADKLCSAIREDTALVSVMNVNNETGVISDVTEIGRRIKRTNVNTLFHVDGVCSFCKIPVDVRGSKIDLFSVSGHKLHTPKGIGGLYVRKGVRIAPLLLGGGQQNGLRSGTENTPFIEAFSAASQVCANQMSESHANVSALKEMLMGGLLSLGAQINGETDKAKSSPYVLNAGFTGMKSQIIINALEERGVYVSAGSACSTNKAGTLLSKPLAAMGIDRAIIEGSVRFSFSKYNTAEEVNICLNAMESVIGRYRRI